MINLTIEKIFLTFLHKIPHKQSKKANHKLEKTGNSEKEILKIKTNSSIENRHYIWTVHKWPLEEMHNLAHSEKDEIPFLTYQFAKTQVFDSTFRL